MKSYRYLLLLACLGSGLCFLNINNSATTATQPPTNSVKENSTNRGIVDKIDRVSQQITVLINSQKHGNGSGIIIAKQGNTYYLLTAAHVVEKPDRYSLVVPDGQQYQLNPNNITLLGGADLAVVSFKSDRTYQVATLGKYNLGVKERAMVFLSGFPGRKDTKKDFQRRLTAGNILSRDIGSLRVKDLYSLAKNSGYKLVYSNISSPGMSGGAILDAQGHVIGIHAAAEGEILLQESGRASEANLGLSLGVPIDTFIAISQQAKIQPQWLKVETAQPPALTKPEITAIEKNFLKVEAPSKEATATDWLNYGNQLWRVNRNPDAIAAFNRAIALQPDFYQAYYARGLSFNAQSKYQQAFDSVKKATEINPRFYQAWKEKAANLFMLGRYSEALADIDRAIALEPNDFVLYWYRTGLLSQLERYIDARAASTKAISLEPDNAMVYSFRGMVFALSNKQNLAIADFNRALQINSENADAYAMRGLIYFDLQQYERATVDFKRALEIDPNNANAYDGRGRVHFFSSKFNEALADFTKAIELNPNNSAPAYVNRSRIYMILGQPDKALADLNQAIKSDSTLADAYLTRASLYLLSQQSDKAIADFNQALQYQPDFALAYAGTRFGNLTLGQLHQVTVYIGRGGAYLLKKDFKNALADADRAIQIFPKLSEVYLTRGSAYIGLEQYEQAVADFNQFFQLAPLVQEVKVGQLYNALPIQVSDQTKIGDFQQYAGYLGRSVAYAQLKQFDKALADLDRAHQINPNADTDKARGDVHFMRKDYQKALTYYQQAISQNQQMWQAYSNSGLVKYEMGDKQAAIKEWQKAMEVNKDATEPEFAIAVALYTMGDTEKGRSMAEVALKLDKRFAALEFLKKNLWGDSLVKDAQTMLDSL